MTNTNAVESLPLEAGIQVRQQMGRVVRMVMKARSVTGKELARLLHLSEAAVSDRLAGRIAFRADELKLLAQSLDVEPGVFFSDPESLLSTNIRWYSDTPVLEAIEGEGPLTLFPERSGRALELVDN